MEKTFTFNTFNEYSSEGISKSLSDLTPKGKNPVIICIGSDLILGDSLGPLIGTLLRQKISTYVYGTLNFPVTAKEVEYARKYIKLMHPDSFIIAIDAAVGNNDDVGMIKVRKDGLMPGLGVDKKLGKIGDASVIGIVASKSLQNYNLFNLTRLNLIYKMAEKISDGIIKYVAEVKEDKTEALFGA